ncbi:MAG: hypothetical protein IJX08_07725, partial [Clostridia bacterium]|nr:hypothetical protein [Clostridia bacterium]
MKKTKLIILGTALLLLCSLTVLGIHAELTDAGKQLQKYDLDCDGKISIADVTALLNCLSGNCTHEKENGICSLEQGRSNDISKDDTVTITDVTVMLDYLARNCNHIEKPLEDVAPTCKQTGLTGGSYCSVCKKVLSTQGEVPTIGHNYVSGKCTMCGAEEYLSTLEVTSVSANKSFLSTGEQVTFSAVTNKDSSALTLTATIYLNGSKISTLSGTGNLKYTPTSAGRYDAEISVTDDGITFFTYFLKSCFDVKDSWELTQITTNKSTVTLGEALVFSPKVSGASSDLSYTVTIYKNGAAYHTAETTGDFTFYPNVAGTYYAVFEAMDSFGEKQSAKSGNVVVKVQTAYNTLVAPNAGTTLNVDDLNGKTGNDVIVPSGKNITLVWDKKSTDSYYRLRISTPDNDTDNFGVSKSNYTSNTYTISSADLVPGNKYRVSVERYDASKAKIESILMYFVVAGGNSILAEDPFAITSPVQAGVYAPNDVTVQWTKMNYASKYVLSLEYYCGAGYHTVLEDIEIDGSQNTYTISKSNLHRGCKHRLEIYVYDDLGNELSETLSFRIEGDPALYEVDKPEITNSHFSDSWSSIKTYPTYEDITITWTKIPAAPYYEILVEDDYGDALVLTNADCVKTNKFVIPVEKLTPGYEYSVRVLASCGDGHSKSSKKYFRAPYPNGATLEGPELTSHDFSKDATTPTTIVEQELTITWKPVSAAVTYNVYLYEVDHDSYDVKFTNLTGTSVTIPKEYIDAWGSQCDYKLRVLAKDSNGSSEETLYYIRVTQSKLEAPIIISPTLATDDEGYLPSFEEDFTITWDAVDGAVSYKVRVWECFDGDFFELF